MTLGPKTIYKHILYSPPLLPKRRSGEFFKASKRSMVSGQDKKELEVMNIPRHKFVEDVVRWSISNQRKKRQ